MSFKERTDNNSSSPGVSPTFPLARSHPSPATLLLADQILADEIVLLKHWAPYKFNAQLTWKENPYNDNSWQLYFHSLEHVSYLLNGFELTADLKYLRKARWHIESWFNANLNLHPSEGGYAWRDHSTSSRVLTLLYFRSCWNDSQDYDPGFAVQFQAALEQHGALLASDSFYAHTNHGIMQDQALLALGVTLPFAVSSEGWIATAKKRLTSRLREDVTPSGVHKEHSPFYHLFVFNLFTKLKAFLIHHALYEGEFDEKLIKMEAVLVHLVTPRRELPLLGDTPRMDLRNRLRQASVSEGLRFVLTDGAAGVEPPDLDVVYPDAGLAIFRSSWTAKPEVMITFAASSHSAVHKHADDLSVCVTCGKTEFLVDCGFYNHDKDDARRQYLEGAFAHNAFVVDHKSYSIRPYKSGKVLLGDFSVASSLCKVSGIHSRYPGVTASRTLTYDKPFRITLEDRLSSQTDHSYTQIFNIGDDVTVEAFGKWGATLRSKIDGTRLDLIQHRMVDGCRKAQGEAAPFRAWRSLVFGEFHPIEVLMFDIRGVDAAFETELRLNPPDTSSTPSA